MNPAIASKGSSFKGAVRYITHDIGENSAERVDGTHTLNLRTDNPEKAAKVMAWTAEHAGDIKRAAGLPATGRKTKDPVYHFALTWEPSQKPGWSEMLDAAQSALKELGFEGHEAVLAAHNDKGHPHIHVVVSRINPETGKTVNPRDDFERLQRWAWQYEKSQGHIYCVDRALKYEKDPELRAEHLKRQTQNKERGQHAENRPRPQWDAEQDAPNLRSKAAQDLRASLAAKARLLADEGRDQAARQKSEASALWQAYQGQKAALWDRQRTEYQAETRAALAKQTLPVARAEAAERQTQGSEHRQEWASFAGRYRDHERAQVNRLFQSQRREFRSFLETSHRGGFVGAIATAIQTARESRGPGSAQPISVDVARFLAATLSADKRAAMFLEGQRAERERLRRGIRLAQAPKRRAESAQIKSRQTEERRRLDDQQRLRRLEEEKLAKISPGYQRADENARTRHAQERTALRADYLVRRTALSARHAEERQALKTRWAALGAERKAAWSEYRRSREQHITPHQAPDQSRMRSGVQSHFGDVARSRDSGRGNSRVRTSDVGRGVSTKARGFSPGRT